MWSRLCLAAPCTQLVSSHSDSLILRETRTTERCFFLCSQTEMIFLAPLKVFSSDFSWLAGYFLFNSSREWVLSSASNLLAAWWLNTRQPHCASSSAPATALPSCDGLPQRFSTGGSGSGFVGSFPRKFIYICRENDGPSFFRTHNWIGSLELQPLVDVIH